MTATDNTKDGKSDAPAGDVGGLAYATIVEKFNSLPESTRAKKGLAPLAFWALAGDEEIVKRLIATGADVNAETDEGLTPLMYAADANSIPVCRLLIEAGANVDAEGAACTTALMRACQKGFADLAAFLMENDADVNREGKTGDTPLLSAVAGGSVDAVELLTDNGADPNRVPKCLASRGFTPLMLAALNGDVKCARVLVDAGADVLLVSKKVGWSAVDVARRAGRRDVLSVLEGAPSFSPTRLALSKAMQASWPVVSKVPVLLLFVFVYWAVQMALRHPEEEEL